MKRRLVCLTVAVLVLAPRGAGAYSVLAHESNIDALWDSHIRPVLLAKYPRTSAAALLEARAYAYGGSAPDDYPLADETMRELRKRIRKRAS